MQRLELSKVCCCAGLVGLFASERVLLLRACFAIFARWAGWAAYVRHTGPYGVTYIVQSLSWSPQAARRVFNEDGAELFHGKDLLNGMHLFVSCGEDYKPRPAAVNKARISSPRVPNPKSRQPLSPSHKTVFVVKNGSRVHGELLQTLIGRHSSLSTRLPSGLADGLKSFVVRRTVVHLLQDATQALELPRAAHRAFLLDGTELGSKHQILNLAPLCCVAVSVGENYCRPDLSKSPQLTTPRFPTPEFAGIKSMVMTPRKLRRVQLLAHPVLWTDGGVLTHTKQVFVRGESSFEALLCEAVEVLKLIRAARRLFYLDGRELTDIADLEDGDALLVSCGEPFRPKQMPDEEQQRLWQLMNLSQESTTNQPARPQLLTPRECGERWAKENHLYGSYSPGKERRKAGAAVPPLALQAALSSSQKGKPKTPKKTPTKVAFDNNGHRMSPSRLEAVPEQSGESKQSPDDEGWRTVMHAAQTHGEGDARIAALQQQMAKLHKTDGQLFSSGDINRDDKLTFKEFCRGVAMIGVRPLPTQEEMKLLFEAYDRDNNGYVDWNELHIPTQQQSVVKMPSGRPLVHKTPDGAGAGTATPRAVVESAHARSPQKSPTFRGKQGQRAPTAPGDWLHHEGWATGQGVDGTSPELSKEEIAALFSEFDYNGNGMLSLAEIGKAVQVRYPQYNHKAVMMRAYKWADADQNGFITKREFGLMMRSLAHFEELWEKFDAADTGNDRRIDFEEFAAALPQMGMQLSNAQARQMFEEIDENGGGQILFDEFCTYFARLKASESDGTSSSAAAPSGALSSTLFGL